MKLHDILDERNILPIRSELIKHDVSSTAPSMWDEVLAKIAPKLKQLGGGSFGLAVDLPGTNYICKIWTQDRGYDTYLRFCQHHESVHRPTFKDTSLLRGLRKGNITEGIVSKFTINGSAYSYAILERLGRITSDETRDEYLSEFVWMSKLDMLLPYARNTIWHHINTMPKVKEVITAAGIKSFRELSHDEETWKQVEAVVLPAPDSWKDFTTKLNDFYNRSHGSIMYDLHNDNIMQRNGVLVITDPFS